MVIKLLEMGVLRVCFKDAMKPEVVAILGPMITLVSFVSVNDHG